MSTITLSHTLLILQISIIYTTGTNYIILTILAIDSTLN
jgi:hypothetical protein